TGEESFEDGARIVGAAVVHEDQLTAGRLLSDELEQLVDVETQALRLAVEGDDEREALVGTPWVLRRVLGHRRFASPTSWSTCTGPEPRPSPRPERVAPPCVSEPGQGTISTRRLRPLP